MKQAQVTLSSAASNYNLARLQAGIGIIALALIAIFAVPPRFIFNVHPSDIWMCGIIVLYGIMMFASSYVEEEQQFWYWIGSGWLGWLWVKR